MTLNKKRLAQRQAARAVALDGDALLAAVDTLCEAATAAEQHGRVEEFSLYAKRLAQISRKIRQCPKQWRADLEIIGYEPVSPEECAVEGADVAVQVKGLCTRYSDSVTFGRAEQARAIAPHIKEIIAACAALTLPDETSSVM